MAREASANSPTKIPNPRLTVMTHDALPSQGGSTICLSATDASVKGRLPVMEDLYAYVQ